MSKWIGYAVSVNCGDPLGCYQGTILEADGSTITLTKAFRNGFPYPRSKVTLKAADIKDLKIIEARAEPSEQTHSTVAVTKGSKKPSRATVCESLQAIPTSSAASQTVNNAPVNNKAGSSRGTGTTPARSKPIDITGNKSNRNSNFAGSYGNAGSTPKCRSGTGGAVHEKARRRNEACFGDAADPALDDDFDFEGNLALFDKLGLWEQMRNSHKPDLVRQTDDVGKFRHDENILGTSQVARHALRVPDELRGPMDYVTDDGIVVSSVVPRLRRQLWEGMQRHGLADSAHTLLARAAADVALRLVGGGRRLEPRNAHQQPVVVALAGAHRVGAVGLAAARLLASHGARVVYHVDPTPCNAVQREEAALALSGVARVHHPDALPSPDLVLLALYDPLLDDPQERHEEVLRWASGVRSAIVALEPPTRGWSCQAGGAEGSLAVRASVAGCAAPALAAGLGRVYLADVAPPLRLFSELRVQYRPPFGAASVLALHPADE